MVVEVVVVVVVVQQCGAHQGRGVNGAGPGKTQALGNSMMHSRSEHDNCPLQEGAQIFKSNVHVSIPRIQSQW